jgi:hypothetical protein
MPVFNSVNGKPVTRHSCRFSFFFPSLDFDLFFFGFLRVLEGLVPRLSNSLVVTLWTLWETAV